MNGQARIRIVGFADPKLLQAYRALESGTFEDRQLHATLVEAIKTLKKNPEIGLKVPRSLWPRFYIKAYDIDNLRKLDLSSGWRLTYTLKGNKIEVMAIILEWMTHKRYEKRFGYNVV